MADAYRLPTNDDEHDGAEGKMGILEHLDELRTRLIRSFVAIAAGMVVAFVFYDRIADFVLAPTMKVLPPGTGLIYTRPGEGFSFYIDVALIGGVILAAPFVMYQVWQFIAPGLYAKEKKLAIPFVLLTTLGAVAGAAFSHYVLFPSMMAFFRTFDSRLMRFMPKVEDTWQLYRNTLLGMMAVFQIPTVVFFLARMGVVTARFLLRNIKYAVLIIFVAAAVLTPTGDPQNQVLFAVPMFALYVLSIGVAWAVAPKRDEEPADRPSSRQLKLVFAATVIDQARRHRVVTPREFPRRWH